MRRSSPGPWSLYGSLLLGVAAVVTLLVIALPEPARVPEAPPGVPGLWILGPDGDPVRGARVEAFAAKGAEPVHLGTSDRTGFVWLERGLARADLHVDAPARSGLGDRFLEDFPLALEVGETRTVELTPDRRQRVVGEVTIGTAILPNLQVHAWTRRGSGFVWNGAARTDDHGAFALSVEPGSVLFYRHDPHQNAAAREAGPLDHPLVDETAWDFLCELEISRAREGVVRRIGATDLAFDEPDGR